MSRSEGTIDRVWTLMRDIGIAMVVTHSGQGDALRARPMAARADADENAIFFLTDAEAPKDEEVARNDNVCLAFCDVKGQRYVSVTGRASVSDDRARIKQLFSAADKAFWRDASDPATRLLRVAPAEAEYWEGPGLIVTAVKMLAAGAAGQRPNLVENEKVRLERTARG
jgi:general stress protein 26